MGKKEYKHKLYDCPCSYTPVCGTLFERLKESHDALLNVIVGEGHNGHYKVCGACVAIKKAEKLQKELS